MRDRGRFAPSTAGGARWRTGWWWRAGSALGAALVVAAGLAGSAGVPGRAGRSGAVHGRPGGTGARAVALSACQGAWTMYQHDVAHTGAATCTAVDPADVASLTPSWFVPTPSPVTDTPAVVDGTVYAGDAGGTFYALDARTGRTRWTFDVTANSLYDDRHSTGFGLLVSSPAVSWLPGTTDPVVFFGGGGTLYALDAVTGAPRWARDLDPGDPTSAIEIESSPVVDTAVSPPEVIVGDDDNGSPGIDETGIQAFDALTGALLWKYEPALNRVVHSLTGQDGTGEACGDVWSSPALDPGFVDPATAAGGQRVTATGRRSADGLVVFGTGNCAANPDPAAAAAAGDVLTNASVIAVDAVTGARVWSFTEPPNLYDTGSLQEPGGGDDDFGSSPLIASSVLDAAGHPLVVEASKDGSVYGLDEDTGALVWQRQDAQPGQLDPASVGSVGGTIGSAALGQADGRPAVFLTSAIPLPFTNDGINTPGSGYEVPCLGTTLPACPDTTVLGDPSRLVSVHAVDAATGAVLWQSPSLPTYAAATYAGGVVFAPSTTAMTANAYDAGTGRLLWTMPLGASPASGMAVAGSSVYLGAGLSYLSAAGQPLPPQLDGIWAFTLPGTERS